MFLENIRSPEDFRKIPRQHFPELATEIRRKILDTVMQNGGHLGSGVGVVELTMVLHALYDFQVDRLFLDTGHQCYPHKLLTGRLEQFSTLRKLGGISGFPSKDESSFDLMTSGHAGTAISMGVGACIADALRKEKRRTVVMVGDASIVSGISFEALNAAGNLPHNLLIILNDNEQLIGRTVGGLSRLLSKVRMSKLYEGAKHTFERLEKFVSSIPVIGQKFDKNVHDFVDQIKHAFVPGQLFEELGFRYFGVFDGHDFEELFDVLGKIQDQPGVKLLHVLTVKGKGVQGCLEDPLALHGVKPGDQLVLDCDSSCGVDKIAPAQASGAPSGGKKKFDFAKCFSEALLREAEQFPEMVAITAGMPDGTGLVPFQQKFPERFFNVGIAEQHAVAFASGLTLGGRRPVCAIYSTFLQRGFDQVFQEVALQRNPVVFVMSHGGLAGDDGPTHHGLFDIALLRAIPGITLLAPRDGSELQEMLHFALRFPGPIAIRYPKAATPQPDRSVLPIELGKAEILRTGEDVALLAYGPMCDVALGAADLLQQSGIHCLVANARFARPLDTELLRRTARFRLIVTLEEAAIAGGFGSAVLESLSTLEVVKARVQLVGVPDRFIEHGSRDQLLAKLGMTPEGVRDTILRWTREKVELRTAPW